MSDFFAEKRNADSEEFFSEVKRKSQVSYRLGTLRHRDCSSPMSTWTLDFGN